MTTIIVDVETTGFDKQARIIEIGAVALDEAGRERGLFGSLVQPPLPLGEHAQHALDITGIREDELRFAPRPAQVWISWLHWMSLYKPVKQVLAFNAQFDRRMLERSIPETSQLPWGECLMKQARTAGMKGKLLDMFDSLGQPLPGVSGHRAVFDARLAAAVYLKCRST